MLCYLMIALEVFCIKGRILGEKWKLSYLYYSSNDDCDELFDVLF